MKFRILEKRKVKKMILELLYNQGSKCETLGRLHHRFSAVFSKGEINRILDELEMDLLIWRSYDVQGEGFTQVGLNHKGTKKVEKFFEDPKWKIISILLGVGNIVGPLLTVLYFN